MQITLTASVTDCDLDSNKVPALNILIAPLFFFSTLSPKHVKALQGGNNQRITDSSSGTKDDPLMIPSLKF